MTQAYLPNLAHILPCWRSYIQKPRLGFSEVLMVMVGGPNLRPDGFGSRILGMGPRRWDHIPGSTPGLMNLVAPTTLPPFLQRGIQRGQNLSERRRSSNPFLLILRRSHKKGRQRRWQVEDKIPGCLPRLLASSKPGDAGCDLVFGFECSRTAPSWESSTRAGGGGP